MCQGDNKTGTVGTNAMFVMTLEDVNNMPPPADSRRTQRSLWIFDPKKRTRTTSESRPVATWLTTLENWQQELQTSQCQNYTGAASWTHNKQNTRALTWRIFTFLCRLNITNTCASPSNSFQFGLSNNMTYWTRLSKDIFTSKCDVWYGDSPKQVYWLTNYCANVLLPTDTTNASKRQDSGDRPHTPFPSPWWWMTSAWNTHIRAMSTI